MLRRFLVGLCLLIVGLVAAESERGQSEPLVALSDATTSQLRSTLPEKEWVILFYADWCTACTVIKPQYHEFASWAKRNAPSLTVAAVNYADNSGLMTRFRITHLPTLYHIREGKYYHISDRRNDLPAYYSKRGWENLQPENAMLTPFSTFGDILHGVGYIGRQILAALTKMQMYSWKDWAKIGGLLSGIIILGMTALIRLQYRPKLKQQ